MSGAGEIPVPPSSREPDEPRELDDIPLEELSVEPPPATLRPRTPLGSRAPSSFDGAAVRPTPLLAREAPLPRDGAPSAPRVTSAPWGRISAPSSPSSGPTPPDPPGRPLHPAALRARPPGASSYLSPRMIAIFGGLFGLATVTSVVALLIQVAPPRDDRAVIDGTAPAEGSPSDADAAAPRAAPTVEKKVRVAIPGPWRLEELAKDASVRIVSGTTERKSFILVLEEKGVPRAQSYRIMKALDGLRKFDKTAKSDRFSVALDRATKKVRAFEYTVSPSEVYQAREGADGLLTGSRLDMKLAEEEVVAAFYVGKDVIASPRAGGLEDGVLDAIDEAFNGKLSSESFEEGGTVRVIAMEETALGLFARYKSVVAVEYRPPDPAEPPVRMYSFTGEQARGYFDERGRQPYKGGWRRPLAGAPITSPFNPKRMHPVLKRVQPHQGTDFGAPTGTPVYSAYRGSVSHVGPAGPAGNLVTIEHPGGIQTGYFHLSRFAAGIKVGDRIGTHQLVGYVGSTGRSTGPHLHFSAKKDGKYFNAETLQLDGERVMPGVDRPAFLVAKAALDARLDAIPLPEPPPEKADPVAAAPAASASVGAPAAELPGDPGDMGDGPAAAAEPGAAPLAPADVDGLEDIVGPALGGPSSSVAAAPPQ